MVEFRVRIILFVNPLSIENGAKLSSKEITILVSIVEDVVANSMLITLNRLPNILDFDSSLAMDELCVFLATDKHLLTQETSSKGLVVFLKNHRAALKGLIKQK